MESREMRIRRIFHEALENPPGERAAFLEKECAGDADLHAEVEGLLQSLEEAGDFLAPREGPSASPTALMEVPGSRVGPYRLLQQIGEGGFGVVFLAEQLTPVVRRVALKVIKLGMDTRQVIARFEAERQALALMDHPNIAKVFDAGATDAGRPYFVMEYVRGEPITVYCDRNELSTRERIALLIDTCHAIQHAHQKGIIHRDIKPSNILVTRTDGRAIPKVIDFGIAKATFARLTEKTLFTEHRQLIGTPEYMSPEQAEMNSTDVDTRSDVYSLGVLLYEVLTGTTPLDGRKLRSAAWDEMLRMIREGDTPKPSTRVSSMQAEIGPMAACRRTEPARLARLLRGDLDWIALKCLEKERARRYETANALAKDLERFLAHEPVSAGRPGLAYHAAKFVRRNRLAVGASGLIALALVGGMTGALLGLLRARDAEGKARANAEDARRKFEIAREGADLLLNDVVRELPDVPGARELQQRILDAALQHYEKLAAEQPGDDAEQRRIWIAFQLLGDGYTALGQKANAKAAHDRFHELVSAASARNPASPLYRVDLASSFERIGMRALDEGRVDDASAAFGEERRLCEEVLERDPRDDQADLVLGGCCGCLGHLSTLKGDGDASRAWYERARGIWERRAAAAPKSAEPRLRLANTLVYLGALPGVDARPYFDDAARLADEAATFGGDTPTIFRARALARVRQAQAAIVSDLELARTHALAAKELLERLIALEPRDPRPKIQLIEVFGVLAEVDAFTAHADEARVWASRAHDLIVREIDLDPETIGLRLELARCVDRLANSAERLGDDATAMALLERARRILAGILRTLPEHEAYLDAACLVNMRLIRLATNLDRIQSAREFFDDCDRVTRPKLQAAPDHPRFLYLRAAALTWNAETEAIAGDLDLADERAGEAVALAERLVGLQPENVPAAETLALALQKQGRFALLRNDLARAAQVLRHEVEILERLIARNPNNPVQRSNLSITLTSLGDVLAGSGAWKEERELRERVLAETRAVVGLEPSNLIARSQLGVAAFRFGSVQLRDGELDGALASLTESIDALQPVLLAHPEQALIRSLVADTCEKLAQVHWTKHDEAAARAWTQRLLAERRTVADAPEAAVDAINSCAWNLLTCVPEDLRDAPAALGYARRVVARARGAGYLDTLALALFESGDASGAAETQAQAIELLGTQDAARLQRYVERLERYRAKAK